MTPTNATVSQSYNNVQQSVKQIYQGHLDEWIEGSAVSPEIAQLNIETLTCDEMNAIVQPKDKITSLLGWMCRGVNWRTGSPMGTRYGQVKPLEPHIIDKEKNKTAKYLTASGMEPDAIFLAMPDKDYWMNKYAEKTLPRVWTEGCKKAGSGLSIGVLTIALTGVWNFGKQSKLALEINAWIEPHTVHYIAFDSDYDDKPSCRKAILKFAELIKNNNAKPLIVTWDSKYKGMDDFIKAEGEEAFKEAMRNAQTIEQWEQQFKDADQPVKGKTKKIPPSDILSKEITEDFRDKLAFNNETNRWMRYGFKSDGVWVAESDACIEHITYQVISSKGIEGFSANSYITNTVKFMQHQLFEYEWNEVSAKEYVPFLNGVLNLQTKQLEKHSPGNRFTWTLPRNYDINSGHWDSIKAFLQQATGNNEQLINILICFANAVLKGRSDLHKVLLCTGQGGSGKSTYLNLLQMLVGAMNTQYTSMEDFCGNRFEVANAYQKRLIVFPDESKYSGNLGNFKKATGGDYLRGEEKGKKAFNFKYLGMVVVASNYPIFRSENSSGIRRRIINMPFNNVVPEGQRRDLEKDFEAEVSAFTQYLLTIPDDVVTDVLRNATKNSTQVAQLSIEYDTEQDSVLAWMNEHLIADTNSELPVGSNKNEIDAATNGICKTAFGHYSDYCNQSGLKAKSLTSFSPKVIENAPHIGLTTTKKKVRSGFVFTGVRLRLAVDDDHIPSLSEQLGNVPVECEGQPCTHPALNIGLTLHSENNNSIEKKLAECEGLGAGLSEGLGAGLKPLRDKECAGCEGLSTISNEKIENLIVEVAETVEKAVVERIEEINLQPVTPVTDVTVEPIQPDTSTANNSGSSQLNLLNQSTNSVAGISSQSEQVKADLVGKKAVVRPSQYHPGGGGVVKNDRGTGTLEIKLDSGRLVVASKGEYELTD